MNKLTLISLAVLLLAGCTKKEEASDVENGAGTPSRVRHGENGETIVTLDDATQKRIGLEVEAITATQLSPEVKGYGRVADPTALASAVGDWVTARAANDASQAELKRLKTLAVQNNASERALQAAEAAAARDEAQFGSARSKLLATCGVAVAGRPDLPALIQSLVSLENLLVRIDLPAGETLKSRPTRARLVTLADEQVEAEFVGEVPAVDPQSQSRGLLFLVPGNSSKLGPGAAVTGYLQISGEPENGVVVPRPAVIRHEGAAWVYVETNGTNFVRHRISLDHPLESGWFVEAGVAAGDRVIVTGAQTIFSEELNAGGFLSGERD